MNWSEQKLELFKFNDNYCVKAGAGSGKTAALLLRCFAYAVYFASITLSFVTLRYFALRSSARLVRCACRRALDLAAPCVRRLLRAGVTG